MKSNVSFRNIDKIYDKKVQRTYKDMYGRFKSEIKGNPLIYTVYRKSFGGFETGLNVLEAGTINGEFFMTKGHKHKQNIDEIYILLSGKGKLLLKDKKEKVLNLKKDKVYVISGKSGHRLINIGKKKLKVLTIYSKNTDRDYNFEFKKRFFK